ncbi:adenosine deaminase family protein [Acidobacteria bacterium AH-259-A15]|nr:adenosine deaminase family protein [Acidobacteria bacterium AH-259-A15]
MHLHLEGAIPWELIRENSDSDLPPTPPWHGKSPFDSFASFSKVMRQCFAPCLTCPESYARAAAAVFQNLKKQNVRYVEISFGLGFPEIQGFPSHEAALAIRSVAPEDMEVRIFTGISRERDGEQMQTWIQSIFDAEVLDGIDLHGDETAAPAKQFERVYQEANERGLFCKAHAGELSGPESVWEVIAFLKVQRIEHGVRAIEDPDLLHEILSREITLDICPTSNVQLGVVPKIEEHPLPILLEKGIRVTVNTDDPTVFGRSLTEELAYVMETFHFSWQTMLQLQENALHAAPLQAERKEELLEELRNHSLSTR